eukprot:TRINITY_DN1213_c4_g1_i1.p2 TRINITY_DN1213_c4_g1~~TRINITY_DN1213_c4_g1_i1.p2  ORF type:complete len:144 (+),score=10.33 TRINITY_DN1213_c4_g1_i1:491-922(+)
MVMRRRNDRKKKEIGQDRTLRSNKGGREHLLRRVLLAHSVCAQCVVALFFFSRCLKRSFLSFVCVCVVVVCVSGFFLKIFLASKGRRKNKKGQKKHTHHKKGRRIEKKRRQKKNLEHTRGSENESEREREKNTKQQGKGKGSK